MYNQGKPRLEEGGYWGLPDDERRNIIRYFQCCNQDHQSSQVDEAEGQSRAEKCLQLNYTAISIKSLVTLLMIKTVSLDCFL